MSKKKTAVFFFKLSLNKGMVKMNFPDKLKKLRKEKGLTQEELASKIFVSRSLIARYENGSVMPSKENLEKLSLFFNLRLSDFIDEEEVVELTLSQNKTALIMEKFFSFLIIVVAGLFSFMSLLPVFKMNRYYFEGSSVPNLESKFFSFVQITLLHNNPIVLITIVFCVINTCLSIVCLVKQSFTYRIWVKMVNYVLFVLILFLIFFSIVFSVIYLNGNLYDY